MQKNTLDSSNIKILVCCHKPCELPRNDIFLPIQVGAAISDIDLGIQRDDQVNGESCDNISAKNKSYCELTAMYWAWKNIKKLYPDLEYIGLNHYRRFFSNKNKDSLEVELSNYNFPSILKQIEKNLLAKKVTILSDPILFPFPLGITYCIAHSSMDFRVLKGVIEYKYPEYIPFFENEIEYSNKFSPFNMFIMRIEDFFSYCEWLFGILFEVEQKIDISRYDIYQKRIYGFMAERLLKVWVSKNTKIRYMPVEKFWLTVKCNNVLKYLYDIMKSFLYSITFSIIKHWGKVY